MKRKSGTIHVILVVLAVALGSNRTPASAHGTLPIDTPIDRLVRNLDQRLAKAPDDPDLHYTLGRLHALAFETKNEEVPVWMWNYRPDRDEIDDDWRVLETKYWVGEAMHGRSRTDASTGTPTPDQLHVHLSEALLHLNRAIEIAPAVASYRLALASILESGAPMAGEVDLSPLCPVVAPRKRAPASWIDEELPKIQDDPKAMASFEEWLRRPGFGWRGPGARDEIVTLLDRERAAADPARRAAVRRLLLEDWIEQIAQQYFVAFSLALPVDGAEPTQPIRGWATREAWIAYEAGSAFVRVVTARGARPQDAVRLAAAKAAIAAFDHLPPSRSITPIVFSLDRARPLADLLDPAASTAFDLDGSGVAQRWPWVARDTAILVWDPLRSGSITSGRQLFGSVSWWLFFGNGYDALNALDDDGDGALTGDELHGLAVWTDRNGDGRSDAGEVVPIERLGVVALSCRATDADGESPCNRRGVTLAGGATLPTFDWIARPLAAPTR